MAEREIATEIVLPKSGFWSGVARLFDFSGYLDRATIKSIRARYRNPPPIPPTDEAIRATWESVGDSMRWAIGEYDKTSHENGTDGDGKTIEVERLRSSRQADLIAVLQGVDADEKRIRRVLRSANDSVRLALTRYNRILGEQEKT